MIKKLSLTLLIPAIFNFQVLMAQIVVNPVTDPVQAAAGFVLGGVEISNVVYTGAANAFGEFSDAQSCGFGLESGLVLSTGSIHPEGASPLGSAVSVFATTNNGADGDALLNTLVSATTYDASVFEFDLIPVGNVLEFQYVFASEEYPEFVGSSFNDVFGFFIDGPNPEGGMYSGVNIALIPDTEYPVAINNINGTVNPSYYIDNEALANQNFVFDGFTIVLTARVNVIAGNTYHLKMAIADAGDFVYDSAIFLKASSMKSYIFSGLQADQSQQPVVLYNPAQQCITIDKLAQGNRTCTISIFNLQGGLLFAGTAETGSSFSTAALNKGIYLVRLNTGTRIVSQKVVVE